jgi:CheY-like chemotaxis protein
MTVVNEVMVIEDDPVTSKLICMILKKVEGIGQTHPFENGKTALDFFVENYHSKNRVPQLILLDINMPVMDGWEFLDELKLLGKSHPIPVFLLTSSINPEDKEMADKRSDVHGFISKPLDLYKVREIIAQIKAGTLEI